MGEFVVHHVPFYDFQPVGIQCMAYNDNLQQVAVGRSNNCIEIWNTYDKIHLSKSIVTNNQSVETLAWVNNQLFSSGLHGNISEYNLNTLSHISSVITSSAIWCLGSQKNKNCLAAGTDNGCIIICEPSEGKVVPVKHFAPQKNQILCLSWHETEPILVSGSPDVIYIWNSDSGESISSITLGSKGDIIIWSIALTRQHVIVTGDSRGKTCFWNSQRGYLINEHQSHKADILTVCIDQVTNIVYSSGVDPTITSFGEVTDNLAQTKIWQPGEKRWIHTHDVKALIPLKGCLLSGGVDSYLLQSFSENFLEKYISVSQKSLVQLLPTKKLLMLRYPHHLELWRLGETHVTKDASNTFLPMIVKPAKILHVQNKNERWIISAVMSEDAQWLALSDSCGVKVFKITMEHDLNLLPKVHLNRIGIEHPTPAHHLRFCTRTRKLLTISGDGNLNVFEVKEDVFMLERTFPKSNDYFVSCLEISPSEMFAAVGYENGAIEVFHLKTLNLHVSLPLYQEILTSLTFCPHSEKLIVFFSNQKFIEYDIKKKQLTPWSKSLNRIFPRDWLKLRTVVYGITFLPKNLCVAYSSKHILFLDRNKPLRYPETRFISKSNNSSVESKNATFNICTRYKHILFVGAVSESMLVIVECTSESILMKLPAKLKYKKFGR